jgi:hypothetical protein
MSIELKNSSLFTGVDNRIGFEVTVFSNATLLFAEALKSIEEGYKELVNLLYPFNYNIETFSFDYLEDSKKFIGQSSIIVEASSIQLGTVVELLDKINAVKSATISVHGFCVLSD